MKITTQLPLFPAPPRVTPTGFVYWATDGTNLKRGFTTSHTRRGGELKLTMLWTAPGTREDEAAGHRMWIRARIPGNLEWYYPTRELLAWLDEHVLPGTVARAALRVLMFDMIRRGFPTLPQAG